MSLRPADIVTSSNYSFLVSKILGVVPLSGPESHCPGSSSDQPSDVIVPTICPRLVHCQQVCVLFVLFSQQVSVLLDNIN
jgi:hypothetical protein